MRIFPLHREIKDYLKKRGLEKKFKKQKRLFEKNPFYPGLKTELLEPRKMRIWSFRIDRKYRAIFIFRERTAVEIIDINDHYQ
ncbi:MAG: type II toxin-antitoxin system mRNA interferase toxin, RelE/StbE family [Patescibacteria group bacterium]